MQSGALPDADLWTVGFLPAGETALPAGSWAASDSSDLLVLTRTARTRNLSPFEQTLMRALVLSAGKAPEGAKSDDLLAERARLMFQIGEASAGAQLLPTLKVAPTGLKPEEVAVDLQLAIGQTDAACLNGVGDGREGAFWARLRAVCFALADNYEEAELAIELAGAQGAEDAWLSRAIFAASGALPNKPEARFDSGLALAISAKAGLEPSINTIANSRLDLAGAIARQDTFSPSMRVQAAGIAAEAGLLSGEAHRALYKALVATDGFSPRTPLEVALHTSLTQGNDDGAKARSLRAALRTSRGNAARYSAVSRLLLVDIKALTPAPELERMVVDFVNASLAAGAPEEAARWAAGATGTNGDKFERAWSAGIIALARGEVPEGGAESGAERLADTLIGEAKTSQQKQAVTRLFVLWSAAGINLPPKARALLARATAPAAADVRKPVAPELLASIAAAADAGAGAETVLRVIAITQGDADRLAAGDAAAMTRALRALGQDDAARQLALEAMGFWQAAP